MLGTRSVQQRLSRTSHRLSGLAVVETIYSPMQMPMDRIRRFAETRMEMSAIMWNGLRTRAIHLDLMR